MIQRIDLQDQVYETVKARVLNGELDPDARLPLQALADELAVSRSPVHHALTRLVTQGLVDVDARGYRVRPVTVKRMEEAHGVRCALELYAADQTLGRLSTDQLAGLRELMERVLFSGPTRTAGDSTEEHRAIVAAYEAGDLAAARAAIMANIETGLQIAVTVIEASGGAL